MRLQLELKIELVEKRFITSKPDKFAIRFHCVVEKKTLHVHLIWDNGFGNLSREKIRLASSRVSINALGK